jgi:hypothetical protein
MLRARPPRRILQCHQRVREETSDWASVAARAFARPAVALFGRTLLWHATECF